MAILKPGSVNLMVADSGVTPVATKQAVAKAIQLSTNKTPTSAAPKTSSATTTKAPSSSGGGYSGGGESASINPNANALSLLAQNYNNSVKTVNDRYALQEQQMRADAEKELREAYINYMMSKKNIDNDMARLGYTGGVTESNRARMYNNYGTIRNDINRRLEDKLNPLLVNKNAELLSLLNNYNNQQLRYAL